MTIRWKAVEQYFTVVLLVFQFDPVCYVGEYPNRNWASQWLVRPALISGFCGMKPLGVFLFPLDGGYLPAFCQVVPKAICWFPFIRVGEESQCESERAKVVCKKK